MKGAILAAGALLAGCGSVPATPEARAREEFRQGNLLFDQGLYAEAAGHYEAVIAVRERMKESYHRLAYCYEVRGDESRAVETLERAARVDPQDDYALKHLWRLYCRRGFADQALGAARSLVKLFPADRDLRMEIARLEGLKGN